MRKLITGFILLFAVLLVYGCAGQDADSGDAMEETADHDAGDAMEDKGNAMEGDAMEDKGDAMESEEVVEAELSEGSPEGIQEGVCGTEAVITVRGCSATVDLGIVEVNFQNNGRGDLEGILFRVLDENDDVLGETSELAEFPIGQTKAYNLDLTSYDDVKKVDAFPITSGILCSNQRNRFDPRNCK